MRVRAMPCQPHAINRMPLHGEVPISGSKNAVLKPGQKLRVSPPRGLAAGSM